MWSTTRKRTGRTYDLVLDVKTSRSPFGYLRTLNPGDRYVTVGCALPRVVQTLCLGPWITMQTGKNACVAILKATKDMAHRHLNDYQPDRRTCRGQSA